MISKKDTRRILVAFILVLSFLISRYLPEEKVVDIPETNTAEVLRVVDGDTLVLLYNGTTTKARLIGIDTPESVDPKRPVECYGKEAKEYVTSTLTGSVVQVEIDDTQGMYDKYGRMLVYVYQNGTSSISVNQELIEKGYAKEYTYNKAYRYVKDFKESEQRAKEKNVGVWNSEACSR
jgi:micrococcal nuclease